MKYLKSFESTQFKSYDFNPRTGEGISADKINEYKIVEIPYNEVIRLGNQELKKLLVGKLVSFKEVVKNNDRLFIKSIVWNYVYDVFITNELNRSNGKNENVIYIWSHNIGNIPSYKNEQSHKVLNSGTIDYLSFNKNKKEFKNWDPFGEETFESINSDYKSIEFIPFNLREEIIPEFVWNKKIEKFSYETSQDWRIYGLMINYEYIQEMKYRLVGKKVDFAQFNYTMHLTTKLKNWIIVDIEYNSRGILIFKNQDNRTAAVDEREIVRVYENMPKSFDENDPFGEEF